MTWKTHQLEKFKAVRVQCSGGISSDDLTMLAVEACFLVKEHGYRKILLDLSEATLTFQIDGLSQLLDVYLECHIPKTIRSAIILGSNNWPENFSKVAAAAKEEGFIIELLVGEQAVKTWLSAAV